MSSGCTKANAHLGSLTYRMGVILTGAVFQKKGRSPAATARPATSRLLCGKPALSALKGGDCFFLPQLRPVTSNLDLKIQTADYGQGGGGRRTIDEKDRNSFVVKILTFNP